MEKLIQISSGRGPVECEWVVGQVGKILLGQCAGNEIETEYLHKIKGLENNTFKSISLWCKGEDLSFLADWIGSIQYIGKSRFRKFHKRKNWFINTQFANIQQQLIDINSKDLAFQSFRSSGPGGQHVNKVSTAMRVIHLPTNISVESQSERSQSQNKKQAIKKLQVKLMLNHKKEIVKNQQSNWMQHNSLIRGNPVKTFKGFPLVEIP